MPTQNAVLFIISTTPSVTINKTATTIAISATETLKAVTYPASQTVTWTSSDSEKASVNSSTGVVTGVAEGTAIITATITVDGVDYTDTCTVTVPAAEN